MNELPLDAVMLRAVREQSARLGELEAENAALTDVNARLVVTNANLRRRLIYARDVHARWRLRAQTWRVERDELLSHLPPNTAATVALRRWGPEN